MTSSNALCGSTGTDLWKHEPGPARQLRRAGETDTVALRCNRMGLWVECYAGYRGEETPRALALGERHIPVIEILDRWLAPDYRYFKVKGEDGDIYIIRHDIASDAWELTMFERSPSALSRSTNTENR
jgi:hypothetical protein